MDGGHSPQHLKRPQSGHRFPQMLRPVVNVRFGKAAPQRRDPRSMSCVGCSCIASVFVIAMVCQYSRVSGLFAWRLPLAMMSSASKVPIG
jgi:hypothetical protein